MSRYNSNIFSVNPKRSRVVIQHETGKFIPSHHIDYYVYNVGKSNVKVDVRSGNSLIWTRTLKSVILAPGEDILLDMSKQKCLVSGVQISNEAREHAFVHCCQVTGYPFYDKGDATLSMNISLVGKILATLGAASIPKYTKDLVDVVNIFWPENQESAWVKISSIIIHLVEEKTLELIQSMSSDLASLGDKMSKLSKDLIPGNKEALETYLNIADDLVRLERKFVLSERDTPGYIHQNFILLAYYSTVVNLKLKYYQFGIVNQQKLSVGVENVNRLKTYSTDLIADPHTGAIAHVIKVRQNRLDLEYKTVYSELLFPALGLIRAYCSLIGTEFFALWNSIVADPFGIVDPYNGNITYSVFFGRPTPKLHRLMVEEERSAPLKPALEGKWRLQPTNIAVYTMNDSIFGEPKIAGIVVTYTNGTKSTTGNITSTCTNIEFDGAHLVKVTAYGWGQIDGLTFKFCDDREINVGTTEGEKHIYQIAYHQIVGFYLATDFSKLEGQAACICVSYQMTPYELGPVQKDKCSILREPVQNH